MSSAHQVILAVIHRFFESNFKKSIVLSYDIMWRQNRCLLRKARLYRAFLLPNRRFPFVDRLELPKSKYQIHRQIESKNLSAFFITLKRRNQICCRKNEPTDSRLGTTPRWTEADGWKYPRTASPSAGSTVCSVRPTARSCFSSAQRNWSSERSLNSSSVRNW